MLPYKKVSLSGGMEEKVHEISIKFNLEMVCKKKFVSHSVQIGFNREKRIKEIVNKQLLPMVIS